MQRHSRLLLQNIIAQTSARRRLMMMMICRRPTAVSQNAPSTRCVKQNWPTCFAQWHQLAFAHLQWMSNHVKWSNLLYIKLHVRSSGIWWHLLQVHLHAPNPSGLDCNCSTVMLAFLSSTHCSHAGHLEWIDSPQQWFKVTLQTLRKPIENRTRDATPQASLWLFCFSWEAVLQSDLVSEDDQACAPGREILMPLRFHT